MGKMSIILVIAATLAGGTMMYSMQSTSLATEDLVSDQQNQYFAREAAFAGLEIEMREYVRQITPANPPPPWPFSTFGPVTETYENATYTVTGSRGSCPSVASWGALGGSPFNFPNIQTAEVISLGKVDAPGEEVYHEVRACYLIINATDPSPPAFNYAFISNDDLKFNSNVDIYPYIEGEGNVHGNETVYLGPNVQIDGQVTMVDEANSETKTDAIGGWGEGEHVPMVPFDPLEYEEYLNPDFPGDVTVPSTGMTVGHDGCTKESPCKWYINGNLDVGNRDLVVIGYMIIVVNGELNVGGTGSVTATGTRPSDHADPMDWIEANLDPVTGRTKAAFYVDGDVEIKGGANFVGTLYTNSDFLLAGGGTGSNFLGSVAAVGQIETKGGGTGSNFWYAPISTEIVIPGVTIPSNVISMVNMTEWKDAVIKYSGGP